jgi:hypothetical protein
VFSVSGERRLWGFVPNRDATCPRPFPGLLVVGDGKGFEPVEADSLGSISFDEARGYVGEL